MTGLPAYGQPGQTGYPLRSGFQQEIHSGGVKMVTAKRRRALGKRFRSLALEDSQDEVEWHADLDVTSPPINSRPEILPECEGPGAEAP